MERSASAVWNGDLKDGKGTISTQSSVLSEAPYSFVTRFENGKGTNPEELIAAAHAGCFTMALSAQLGDDEIHAREPAHHRHRHAGKARRRLDDLKDSPGRHRAHPRHFSGRVRIRRGQREAELPRVASVQSRNHHDGQTGTSCMILPAVVRPAADPGHSAGSV